ncbi:isopeptide-forming domain-containing fimbrial protein [Kitasatospora kazusensis]
MRRLFAATLAWATVLGLPSVAIPAGADSGASQPRAAAGACTAQTSGYNQCQVFRASSSAQTFTPPAGATSVRFHLWGGGGGNSDDTKGAGNGGGGGYTVGNIAAPLAASYSINVASAASTSSGAGTGGGAAWVKDKDGTVLLVAGGGGGGGRGASGGAGGAGGGADGTNGADAGGTGADAKGGSGATGKTGGAAGAIGGTRAGKAGADGPIGAGGAGGAAASSSANGGGAGGAGYAGGAGGDAGAVVLTVTQSAAGGGGGSGYVNTDKVPKGTTTAGSGKTAGGTDDPFYDKDTYGAPKTAGAVVVEWQIPAVKITSPTDGETIGTTTEFTGTGMPGATVTLTRGSTSVGSATVATDGTWSIIASGQTTGTSKVTYTATQTATGAQALTDSVGLIVSSSGTITGKPVTSIQTTTTGRCYAYYNDTKQFFSDSCGTGLSVGGKTYGGADYVSSGSSYRTQAVNQTPTTGKGTSADPYTMTTEFTAATVMSLSQTETYVDGENGFRIDITVTNNDTKKQTGNLYRAGDCYLQGSDSSYGLVLPAAPGLGSGIACVKNKDGTGQSMMFVPLTAGSKYSEGKYGDVRDEVQSGKALSNTCDCANNVDSGMAISWPYELAAGASKTFSFYTYFRPSDVKQMTSEKTVSPSKVKPGDTVTYTVKFTNPNDYPVTTFGFTDTLDSRLDYVAGSSKGTDLEEPTVTGSQVGWAGAFTVAKKASYSFTFQAKVKSTATIGTATNDFSGDGLTTLSKVAPVAIAPQADLTVTKTVDKPSVLIGSQMVFTVTVKNDGPNAAVNVVLTDQLPSGLTYVSDDSGKKYDTATGKWTVGGLAKDATATLKITAKAAKEGEFLNAVTALTSDTFDSNTLCTDASKPATCPNAKVSVNSSDLAMSAATAPNPVTPGGTSTATLTVTNKGPLATASAATVTFTLPQHTTLGSPLPSGCTKADDGKSVTCTIAAGLAKDATSTFAIPLVVASDAPLATALSGGSAVVASPDDPDTTNNTASVALSTTAKASNDLSMAVSAPTDAQPPGTVATVTATVKNLGPSDTTSASTVTVTMPANTKAAATQPTGCTAATDRKTVTCTIAAGLKAGTSTSFAVAVAIDQDAPLDTTLSGGKAAVANTEDGVATNNSADFTLKTTAKATADLAITKAPVGSKAVAPGETFEYQLTVTNKGPSQAVNTTIVDTLQTPLTFVSSDSGCTASGQKVTCALSAALSAGASKVVKITVRLDSAYSGDGTDIKNQASVSSDATDPDLTNNTSDASTGHLPGPGPDPGPYPPAKPSADLAITKKPVGTTSVAAGESFEYQLTVTNKGPSEAAKVVVTDVLQKELTFVSGDTGCAASGQTVTCSGPATLAPAGTKVYTIKVMLDPAYAGDGKDIKNQASVKSDTADPDQSNNTSDASTGGLPGPGPGPNPPVSAKADLAITKKPVGTTSVAAGEAFEYQLTVTNKGPSQAANVVVTDTLQKELLFVSGDTGCAVKGQVVTCTGPATLAPAGSKVYTVKVQLDPAYSGDGKDIKNQASVKSDTADPDQSNNTSDASTGGLPGPGPGPNPPVSASADLAITKKPVGSTSVAAGEVFEYQLTVTNRGPSEAANVVVTDVLQKELTFVSSVDGCAASGQTVTCSGPATLAPSGTKVYTVKVMLDPAYSGDGKDIKNQASVKSDTADPDQSNNTSDASTGGLPGPGPGPNPPVSASADLAITKKPVGSTSVAAGEVFEYQLTVTNKGPSQAANVVVTDVLQKELTFVSSADGCAASGQTVTCTGPATLAPAGSKVYTIKVQLDPAYSGDGKDIKNQASVKSDTADPDQSNNTSDASTGGLPGPGPGPNPPVSAKADLAITKKPVGTTSVAAGEVFEYQLTVTNKGPSQSANVVVTDVLQKELTFVSSADGCAASGQTITCTGPATLAPAGTKVYTVKVMLDPAYSGDGTDIKNQASVKSDTPDPDQSNNTSDASTGGLPGPGPGPNPPAKPSADLAITKAPVGSKAVAAGETFEYELTVTNKGPSQAANPAIVDSLQSPLTFVSSDSGCTASGQKITCALGTSLSAGASKVVKITVKLDPAYSGDGTDISNQASVKSDTADPDLSNNTSDASTGHLPGPGPGPNPPAKQSADLAITKKPVGSTSVAAGEAFEYELTVTNKGPSQAANVVVTDTLQKELTFVSGDTGCAAAGQTVTCTGPSALAPSASKVYTIKVQLDPAYSGDGTDIKNQASVKSDTADPDQSNNTSDASTGGLPGPGPGPNPPVSAKADLAITKKPVGTTPVAAGEAFEYQLTVTNKGPSQAANVVVTDVLQKELTFVSSADGCAASGQTITCTGPATLAPAATKVYTVKVQLDPAYSGDGTDIKNQASVKSDTPDPDQSNNTSDASTGGLPGPGPGPNPPVSAKADLAITKKPVGTTPVAPGESFEYQLTVTNKGPSQAANVVVTDTLQKELSFVSGDTGCAANGQTVTCTGPATLAPAASKVYTVKVQLDPAYSGDGTDIKNQASVKSDTADPDQSNNTSDASTGGLPGPGPGPNPPVSAKADLAITKKPVGTTPVAPGETFEYSITVTNKGPSQAANVVVTDTLPAHLSFVSASDGCTASGQAVTCPALATLAAKAAHSYTIKVQLDPAYSGDGTDIKNQASVKSDTADPDQSNNTSDASTGGLPGPGPGPTPPAPPKADLAITKKPVGTTPVAPGGEFEYEIVVTNNGPSPAKNVKVADKLPEALTFVSGADCASADAKAVSCGPIATLAVKGTQTYRIKVMLDPHYAKDGSDIANQASVKSDTADPDQSNNTSDATTGHLPGPGPGPNPPAKPSADLAITKKAEGTAAVAPGETFTYVLTVTNNGPSPAKNVKVADKLPVNLAFVSSPDGCAATGQDVACGPAGEMAANTAKVFKIVVRLDAAYTGDGTDIANRASVSSDTADPDQSNNTSDATTGHLPGPGPEPGPYPPKPASADLAITKKPVGTAPVRPGTDFDYLVTVTNNGPSQAVNVVVTDVLPAQLSFVASSSGCTSSGTPNSGSESVTCPTVATLAAKATKTFTITVKLAEGYAGDGKDIRNQASVKSDTPDPDQSNNTSDASAGGLPGPGPGPNPPAKPNADLAITKTGVDTGVKVPPGGTFGYDLKVTNKGPSTAKNTVIADVLPSQLAFVSADPNSCTASGTPYSGREKITCPLGDLANGEVREVKVTVRLAASFRPQSSDQAPEITNTATVSSDAADPNTSDNSATASGVPGGVDEPATDLAVSKQFDPATPGPVSPGETYSYLITITNLGPSEAARFYRVVDTLPPALTLVGYTNADTGQQLGCEIQGLSRVCPVGDLLAVGRKVVTRMTVRLSPDYAGDGSDILNTATVSARNADPDQTNNTDAVTGLPNPDCKDPKAATPGPECPGKPGKPKSTLVVGHYHDRKYPGEIRNQDFQVYNLGPSTTREPATLTIGLPQFHLAPKEPLPPECVEELKDTRLACTIPAGLKPSGPRSRSMTDNNRTYTTGELRFRVDPLAVGGTTVTGPLTVAYAGPDGPAQATGAWSTEIPGAEAGLVVTKTAVPSANGQPVTVSNPFDYVITVANQGPSAARKVFVTDPLPTALVFAGSSTGCLASGQSVTCPVHDPLLSGGTITERISVKLSPSYSGDGSDIFNTATVHSDTPNRLPDHNSAGTGGLNGIKVLVEGTLPKTGVEQLAVVLGWAAALTALGATALAAARRRRRGRGRIG